MAIYLSHQDVLDLAHYAHIIPVSKGYTQQYMAGTFPGVEFNDVLRSIRAAVRSSGFEAGDSDRRLPHGAVGVLAYLDGTGILDDGSLDHPAKEDSWRRSSKGRLPEHGLFNVCSFHHPVLVHTPHTSRHIPHLVRRDLLVSDDELTALLDMLTDDGVTEFMQRALAGDHSVNWVTATMSRLVVDVARLDWDPNEAIGMGAVHTRQPDGRPLRDLPDDDLWWLQLQHRAYTGALERYVGTLIDYSGTAIVLDVHSYGTAPGPHETDSVPRPEVCFGTDALHTPDWLRAAATVAFGSFDVQFDTAFTGTYLPGRQWIDDPSVSSISIKVRQDVLATPSGTERAAAALRSLVDRCRRHASDAHR